MTQPVNTLGRDLELWFQPESRTFNSQRGVVRDLSGYGRELEASGGLSVSDDGYRGFGQASFDGSDDSFDTGNPLGYSQNTTFSIVKINVLDGSERRIFDSVVGGAGQRLAVNPNNNVEYGYIDGGGDFQTIVSPDISENEWASITARYDGETHQLFIGDAVDDQRDDSFTPATADARIGASQPDTGGYWDGDIAFFGSWSRPLSNAEIAHLNRLTGPREARL